jgi:hypothetical protein
MVTYIKIRGICKRARGTGEVIMNYQASKNVIAFSVAKIHFKLKKEQLAVTSKNITYFLLTLTFSLIAILTGLA